MIFKAYLTDLTRVIITDGRADTSNSRLQKRYPPPRRHGNSPNEFPHPKRESPLDTQTHFHPPPLQPLDFAPHPPAQPISPHPPHDGAQHFKLPRDYHDLGVRSKRNSNSEFAYINFQSTRWPEGTLTRTTGHPKVHPRPSQKREEEKSHSR